MNVAAGLAALFVELVHEWQNWVTDNFRFVAEAIKVHRFYGGFFSNFVSSFLRDHAAGSFSLSQSHFRFDVLGNQTLVIENGAHFGGTERVTIKNAVKNGARHVFCSFDK